MCTKRYFISVTSSIVLILCIVSSIFSQSSLNKPLYLDFSQPIDKRVEDLLSKMTLEEKVGQINWPCVYMDRYGEDIPAKKKGVRKFVTGDLVGIGPGGGFFTLANEISREGTRQQAESFNVLQQLALDSTGLGIPLMAVRSGR